MLAGKIFSADPVALTAPVLDLCEQHPSEYGVELALYGAPHFDPVSEQRIHMLAPSRKSLHSLHRCMGLTELAAGDAAALDRLSAEATKARELRISRYVVHAASARGSGGVSLTPKQAAHQWAGPLEQMHALGLRPLLENTFQSLTWLTALYEEWAAMGLAPIAGFCLDTGHTRVWERTPLLRWSEFTRALVAHGFALHFHVHANDGADDSHIALHVADETGLLEHSADWAPNGFMPWLGRSFEAHPDALFVLENEAAYARDAFVFARFVLDDAPVS